MRRVFRADSAPAGGGDDGLQQLMDLARLRHIDAFLKALSSSGREAPEASASPAAAAAMQRCVGPLLEMFHDPRRAGSLIVFYLDHSPIDESLPESLPAVGKVPSESLTLHPTPNTLHPMPSTLHPTPYTLHPLTYTLHPERCAPHPLRATWRCCCTSSPSPRTRARAATSSGTLNPPGIQGISPRVG